MGASAALTRTLKCESPIQLGQIVIHVPERLTNQFKKQAKASFPNETYAYLLGHHEDGKIFVDDLYSPPNIDDFCAPGIVNVQWDWITSAKRHGRRNDMIIVGDIHSHPYNKAQAKKYSADLSPSETDWDGLAAGQIMGICLVKQTKDGKLRAKTKFYGPMPQVKVKTTK